MHGSASDIAPKLPLLDYVQLAIAGIGFFALQHVVLNKLIPLYHPKYLEMTSRDFHDYRMNINCFIHAVLATYFSVYCMFYTCGDGKTFFNDEECRLVPRNGHVWTVMFTAGYLFVESIVLVFLMGVKT